MGAEGHMEGAWRVCGGGLKGHRGGVEGYMG